jgi:hypothetical protein
MSNGLRSFFVTLQSSVDEGYELEDLFIERGEGDGAIRVALLRLDVVVLCTPANRTEYFPQNSEEEPVLEERCGILVLGEVSC